MFIKIKNTPSPLDAGDSFTIIDNIKTVNYFCPIPKRLESIDELLKYRDDFHMEGRIINYDRMHQLEDPQTSDCVVSKENPYLINVINFTTYGGDEDGEQWMFDTVAYIVSDDGKTIEKAAAGGLLSDAIKKLVD